MKLWTSSRKLHGGLRRYTWWRGRNKIFVAHVQDGHYFRNDLALPIRDDSGEDWPYLIAYNGKGVYSQNPLVWDAL